MRINTVINAKGGCGKSTVAINLAAALGQQGYSVLLSDMDPQAQVTEWVGAGDGLTWEGSIVAALIGKAEIDEVIFETDIENVSIIPSAFQLEEYGRDMVSKSGYQTRYAECLADIDPDRFDFMVIDSPNQISPVMENCIYPADLFVVPFDSTKAVKSYANVYSLLQGIRPDEDYEILHVMNGIARAGLRNRVVERLQEDEIEIADTEVRNCGWLAQVDEYGGSIFDFRPYSNGAEDMMDLSVELLAAYGIKKRKKARASK
jgi:chromosome partitioning protein